MKDDAVDRFMDREYMASLVEQFLDGKGRYQRSYESKLGARYIVEYRGGRWIVYGFCTEIPVKEGKK